MDGLIDREIRSFLLAKEIYPNFSSLTQHDKASDIESDSKVKTVREFTKGAIVDLLDSIHEF